MNKNIKVGDIFVCVKKHIRGFLFYNTEDTAWILTEIKNDSNHVDDQQRFVLRTNCKCAGMFNGSCILYYEELLDNFVRIE